MTAQHSAVTIVDGPYGLGKYPGDTLDSSTASLYREVFAHSQSPHLVLFGTFWSLSWLRQQGAWPELPYRGCVVWHKPDWVGGAVKRIRTFSPRHEMFLHFSSDDAPFHSDAVRVPYGDRACSGVKKKTGRSHGWTPNVLGARRGDVWTITSDRLSSKVAGRTQPARHPCVKPRELLELLVLSMSLPGEVIVEPFVGSDNLKRVCLDLGRVYLGFDRAEDFLAAHKEEVKP